MTTGTHTTSRVGRARFAWGSALTLGAASAMGPALFSNLSENTSYEVSHGGHEAPNVVATTSVALESDPPAPETSTPSSPHRIELVETVTDPDDTRAAVVVDQDLWVATGGGLLRFDPEDPSRDRWWTTADGLPDHRLTAIARYGDGLALGTEGGLVVTLELPTDDGLVVHTADAVSEARISDLLTEDELLWVATWGDGAFSGVPGRPKGYAALGPSRGLRARQLTGIARLDGELVAGTAGAGLWVRGDDGRSRLFVQKGGLVSDFVLDVATVGDAVLVAGLGGISRYRAGVIQTRRGGDRVPAGVVTAIGTGKRAPFLAIAGGRVGRWGATSTQPLPAHPDGLGPWHGVPTPEARWIAQMDGVVVAGTARGILQGTTWRTHQGPGSNDLTSVSADRGDLLVGTWDGGAWLRAGDHWDALPAPSGEVNDVQLDDGSAWLATSRGLARVDNGQLRSWGPLQGLASENVSAISFAGDRLLVRTSAGLQLFDGVGFLPIDDVPRFRDETSELPDSGLNPDALLSLDDGTTLVGTLGEGLLRVDPRGALDRWTATDGLAGNDVTGLSRDGDTVWVATRSGLSSLSITPVPTKPAHLARTLQSSR